MNAKGIITLGQVFENMKTIIRVMYIYLHSGFHTDEAMCYWLSRSGSFTEKVEKLFPGIKKAQIVIWSLGQMLPARDEADALSFGCRGSKTDEHVLPSEEYAETSAAQMLATICGLRKDKALEALINKNTIEDRFGSSHKDESLHAIMKMIHRMEKRPSERGILAWYSLALEAEYQLRRRDEAYLEKDPPLTMKSAGNAIRKIFGARKAGAWMQLPRRAKSNFRSRKRRMMIKLTEDREKGLESKFWSRIKIRRFDRGEMWVEDRHWMCVIETDSLEALKCALDLNASVVIIQNSDGNSVIVTDRKKAIDLSDVALMLREEELFLMGEADHKFSPEQLRARGSVEGWKSLEPYWHLHDLSWMYFWKMVGGQKKVVVFPKTRADAKGIPFSCKLYNGSESSSGVYPSRIPLKDKVKIVKICLEGKFHSKHFSHCIKGECTRRCYWFRWNLAQCVHARGDDRV